MQEQFKVDGMSCQHCVRAVQEAIEQIDPAAEVSIDLAAGQVAVDAQAPRDLIRRAIEEAGYRVA